MDRLRTRAKAAGLSTIIVYGDREHFANMAYFLDFEPRFEEALLVVSEGCPPLVITGPENTGRARVARVEVEVVTYPTFGLLGQKRQGTPPLADLLGSRGIGRGSKVGIAGWKYFTRDEAAEPESWIEAPAFIVDTIRTVVGPKGRVVNATALLMDPSSGMRAVNEIDQLAQFEYASCYTSEAIKRVLFGIRPGMREQGAVQRLMQPNGAPLSCHIMLTTGPEAYFGLNSPRDRVMAEGEPLTMAYGTWGAVTCLPGRVVGGGCRRPPRRHPRLCRPPGRPKEIADLLELDGLTVTGRSLGENIATAENFNCEVIHPRDRALAKHGGIAVLRGNLAPNGAIIKPSAASPKLMRHRGRAVVFESIENYKARVDDPDLDVDETSVSPPRSTCRCRGS